jgi:tetratricopeptide (TPR) repeat protein
MRRPGLLAATALLLLLALLAWRSVVDIDVGIHLAGGRWIAEHRAVPTHDPFTWSIRDHAYVAYHWLFQVGLYAAERVAGVTGMAVLRLGLLLATGVLLLTTLRARATSAAAGAALGLAALIASEWRFTLRPELVSLGLAAASLYVLERRARRGWIWLLPPIQLVWANTHVHVIGLAILACYALEDVVRARSLRTPLVGVGLLSALAALVNPYGVTGALAPLTLAARFSSADAFAGHIAELVSPLAIAPDPAQPFSTSAALFSYRVLLAFGLLAIPLLLRARHLADAAIVAVFGVLSALAVRNVALYAVVSLPALARALDLLLARLGAPARRRADAVLLYGACFLALLQIPRVVSGSFYAGDRRLDRFAAELCDPCLALETADWLAHTAPAGPLLNNLALGSTLIWRAPGQPVFVDGRNEVSGEAFYEASLRALDPAHFEEARARWGFETVALAHRGDARAARLAAHLVRDPGWRLVHVDGAGVVFVRAAGPNAALPAAALPAPVAPEERERLFAEISVDAGPVASLRRWLGSREPPPGAVHGLGNFLARIDLFEAAERPLLEAALESPGFYEPHLDLGLLYQRARLRRLALASYKHALALAPDHPDLVKLGEALEQRQNGQLVDSVPPSTSMTLPVTQDDAGDAR